MDRGLLDNLKELLQERISFSESVRNNHAKGEDAYDPILPKAVLFPKNNDELSRILIICNEFNKPGSAIIFPSFINHKVNKITSGKRHTLAIWLSGPKFR